MQKPTFDLFRKRNPELTSAILEPAFPDSDAVVDADVLHSRVDALLDELVAAGERVPQRRDGDDDFRITGREMCGRGGCLACCQITRPESNPGASNKSESHYRSLQRRWYIGCPGTRPDRLTPIGRSRHLVGGESCEATGYLRPAGHLDSQAVYAMPTFGDTCEPCGLFLALRA